MAALSLSGCATIVEGTTYDLAVTTYPAGATCAVDRDGERVGVLAASPGVLHLSKSNHTATVTCTKAGYYPTVVAQTPYSTGAVFGNFVIGGAFGFIVDAASGANVGFPNQVSVGLAPRFGGGPYASNDMGPGSSALGGYPARY